MLTVSRRGSKGIDVPNCQRFCEIVVCDGGAVAKCQGSALTWAWNQSIPIRCILRRERRPFVWFLEKGRALRRLPFVGRIYWKTLAVVVILVVATWWIVLHFGFYEKMTPADYGGTVISTILFAYLVHLWLLPAEILRGDDKDREEHDDH